MTVLLGHSQTHSPLGDEGPITSLILDIKLPCRATALSYLARIANDDLIQKIFIQRRQLLDDIH